MGLRHTHGVWHRAAAPGPTGAKEGQIRGRGTEPFPIHIRQNNPLLQIRAWLRASDVTTLFFILLPSGYHHL